MLNGLVIDTEGTIVAVAIDDSTEDGRRQKMREYIGCAFYDVIGLPENIDVWVDDEGLYRQPLNPELSALVSLHRPYAPVHGNALILGHDGNGETVSLTLDQMASVVAWWRTVTTGGNDPAALRPRLALA